jgi:hypothetical protein
MSPGTNEAKKEKKKKKEIHASRSTLHFAFRDIEKIRKALLTIT